MKKDANVISVHELDDEKKDSITRYALEKMLKDIKAAMTKNRKVKITIEKMD
jgi:F0F1-type ATP synthase delta subunit